MSSIVRGAESPPVPDSTTEKFRTGDDVLLKQKDGRYYLGTVVQVDLERERCLVKFGDNTDSWSPYALLAKLMGTAEQQEEQERLLCVVCKRTDVRKEVTVCSGCLRGYHRKCHEPKIAAEFVKDDSLWNCRRCEPQKHMIDLKQQPPLTNSSGTPKVLPYDLNSLHWDTYHRVNKEHTYCYCGYSGEWDKQMLQCNRCKQWFHGRCLTLKYPLYCGDRFYVFVCSICNEGREFVRRLELKWVDLVHLILYNLTSFNGRKYYDLDKTIIPYIHDNWTALQLPPKIVGVARCDRRSNVLSVLTNDRKRFKCGREIKKRTTIWGLRVLLPPPAPHAPLPLTGRVTEDDLRNLFQGSRRLHFLPLSTGRGILEDNRMQDLMRGTAHLQSLGTHSESDSPCPSPELAQAPPQPIPVYGAGAVKKTTPTVPKKRTTLAASRRRNTNDGILDIISKSDLPPTPPTSVSAPPTPPAGGLTNEKTGDMSSGDETSSRSTLDLIIPPPKDFEGKNNPFLGLLRGSGPAKKTKDAASAITLPLPLTAVIPGKPLMRPTKRQLSEKDIFIGPNGEVKRRRFRRNARNFTTAPTTTTASKTATVLPARPDWDGGGGQSDYINGRRLRQRTVVDPKIEKEKEKPQQQQTSTSNASSPVKTTQEPSDLSMDDLKSSVNIYFGAPNRIAAGEKFQVKAKRIGPSGKLEFLIEWDGLT